MARLRSIYADYEEEDGEHVTKSILLFNSYKIFLFKFFLNNGKNRVIHCTSLNFTKTF